MDAMKESELMRMALNLRKNSPAAARIEPALRHGDGFRSTGCSTAASSTFRRFAVAMKRILILGGGFAAISCAQKLEACCAKTKRRSNW